ncbi:efflux RND transporter periplasmic adaptor subunit [Verticiella sediminum]|uniref:Efflux RND transporter periplasmic adaptor subunit n=1 Tax=Verticiella sediminum TaxID=1247510 RepID=A0A556AUN4_9BURK|nr:efflux RND transporter periplasmic adaptor subunit [Verticiella sediminum]TSH96658.1 efflux RND transporter periplasmic adaptor subunit [Verticiella sediminum]
MSKPLSLLAYSGIALMALAISACGNQEGGGGPGANGQQTPPTEVGYVTVQPQSAQNMVELPGRLEAVREAQVRARVPGIVLKRTFEQGTDVKEGDLLYQIDPAPLRAAYNAAQANVQQAEAQLYQARQLQRRYQPLVEANAVSRQEYDQAVAGLRQGEALVAQQKAAAEQARLNLGYANVTAPISGRIGNALVTEGALVGQSGEATPLAVIQQLDPIYVNFTQSANELLALQQALASGELSNADGETPVTLLMANGQKYAHQGKLLSTGVSVDPSTGQITLRAEFPNPDRQLLPGMYVRGQVVQGVRKEALMVPSRAVQRQPGGSAYVLVIDENSTAQARPIQTGPMSGENWIVEKGLNPGDRVIVDRFQQVRPGAPVKPTAPAQPADAQAGDAGQGAGQAGSAAQQQPAQAQP